MHHVNSEGIGCANTVVTRRAFGLVCHFSRLKDNHSSVARIFVSYLLDWAHTLQPHAVLAPFNHALHCQTGQEPQRQG